MVAMRYPPLGARSHGPIRAGTYGEAGTYYRTANADIICMPMIETEQAVANIDAILDVPGIDAVYIGPGDLGLSMGLAPALDREEPEILEHYETVLRACEKRGIYAGLHTATAAYAARMMQMGFRFVVLASDSVIMREAPEPRCRLWRRPERSIRREEIKLRKSSNQLTLARIYPA